MMYVYLCITAIFVILMMVTWQYRKECKQIKPKVLQIFACMAVGLRKIFGPMRGINTNKKAAGRQSGVAQDMRLLYPDRAREEEQNYRLKKAAYVILILFGGSLVACCLSVVNLQGEKKLAEQYVMRNSYGEGSREETFLVQMETERGSFEEEVTVFVEAQTYTEEEAYAWIDQGIERLPELILGENADFDHITENMNLVQEIDDMPVSIEWVSGDYRLLDNRGRIMASELPEEGTICMLTAKVTCEVYEKECTLYVCLYPQELGYVEQLRADLDQALRKAEAQDRTNSYVNLPVSVNGQEITWIKKKKDDSVIFLIMTILFAVGIWFAMDRDIHKKVQEREEQMRRDYPELISKLVLYMGAGMTIRGAVHKIATDQDSHSCRSAYREIVRICHEMDSGISEGAAYLNLGKRCKDAHYVRLSMLLSQNLRKGNAGLIQLLEKEAEEAFDERKRNARKYGEEAGTKLLLPMLLMLMIVMVVIMVPAFVSFGN